MVTKGLADQNLKVSETPILRVDGKNLVPINKESVEQAD